MLNCLELNAAEKHYTDIKLRQKNCWWMCVHPSIYLMNVPKICSRACGFHLKMLSDKKNYCSECSTIAYCDTNCQKASYIQYSLICIKIKAESWLCKIALLRQMLLWVSWTPKNKQSELSCWNWVIFNA